MKTICRAPDRPSLALVAVQQKLRVLLQRRGAPLSFAATLPVSSAMPISLRPMITLIRNCSEEERRRKRQIMHLAQTHQTLISNG
jgi:hypothetical protein